MSRKDQSDIMYALEVTLQKPALSSMDWKSSILSICYYIFMKLNVSECVYVCVFDVSVMEQEMEQVHWWADSW